MSKERKWNVKVGDQGCGCAAIILAGLVLTVLCIGDPDLLDAIIKRVGGTE